MTTPETPAGEAQAGPLPIDLAALAQTSAELRKRIEAFGKAEGTPPGPLSYAAWLAAYDSLRAYAAYQSGRLLDAAEAVPRFLAEIADWRARCDALLAHVPPSTTFGQIRDAVEQAKATDAARESVDGPAREKAARKGWGEGLGAAIGWHRAQAAAQDQAEEGFREQGHLAAASAAGHAAAFHREAVDQLAALGRERETDRLPLVGCDPDEAADIVEGVAAALDDYQDVVTTDRVQDLLDDAVARIRALAPAAPGPASTPATTATGDADTAGLREAAAWVKAEWKAAVRERDAIPVGDRTRAFDRAHGRMTGLYHAFGGLMAMAAGAAPRPFRGVGSVDMVEAGQAPAPAAEAAANG